MCTYLDVYNDVVAWRAEWGMRARDLVDPERGEERQGSLSAHRSYVESRAQSL